MDKNVDKKLINLEGLPASFFAENRNAFFTNLKKKYSDIKKNSVLILEGGKEIPRHDTDTSIYHFIQESYFYYLSGVNYPDFHMILNLDKEESVLFIKMPNLVYKIFMHVLSPEEATSEFGIPCYDDKEIINYLIESQVENIYKLKGINSDSGSSFKDFVFEQNFTLEHFLPKEVSENKKKEISENYHSILLKIAPNEKLTEILADTRVIKSEQEIDVIRFTCEKSVEAHIEVMKKLTPGQYERDSENVFYSYVRNNYYSRELPYNHICGCGNGSSTLHYNKNDEIVKDGDLFLLDMGTKIGGYCADITNTIPVNGKFTKKQKEIYDIVLKANREVIKNLKEGVDYTNMHILAERIILEGLQEAGILKKDYSIDEMHKDRVSAFFMPHGLGHLLGIDVHDVGGYLSFTQERSQERGLRSLRTRRILAHNTVLTVEPGIYFRKELLEEAFSSSIAKYFNIDFIKKDYFDFGGIRIEDVVVVRKDGCENLSESLPRSTEDIEKIMKK